MTNLAYKMDLRLFDLNPNTTGSEGLSAAMKTFYADLIIDEAEPKLVHNQFGQRTNIPANRGKIVEFRRYSPLPKALTPLQEAVTPDGQSISMTTVTGTVYQYGAYVSISDLVQLAAIDNTLTQVTKLLGSQSGRTIDTITRDVLAGGSNVVYAGSALGRHLLVGGESTGNSFLNVDAIKRAARFLKVMNAETIGNSYVAIVHPDTTFDLTNDERWLKPHEYVDTSNIYNGEIGKIDNVRFVESTEAKKTVAPDLVSAAVRNLTVASLSGKVFTIDEALTAGEATALKDRKVIIKSVLYTVASAAAGAAGAATITVTETVTGSPTDGEIIYPGEAGAKGRDVYSTLVLAENAYGVTEITGGGLEHIFHPHGSGGTADPLNQRATAGWKATHLAMRLVEEYMIRIEACSTFNDHTTN